MEASLNNSGFKRPLDYYVLMIAVIVSLGLNFYILNLLQQARVQVGQAAGDAAGAVGQLRNATIEYQVEIRETLPISLTIDYNETVVVPISYTLPINTQVSVPLRTPLGVFPITVPVVTSIPINLAPEVPLSISVPISLTVPVAIDVPIRVELKDTALGDAFSGAEQYLLDLADDLGSGQQPASDASKPPPTATPQ